MDHHRHRYRHVSLFCIVIFFFFFFFSINHHQSSTSASGSSPSPQMAPPYEMIINVGDVSSPTSPRSPPPPPSPPKSIFNDNDNDVHVDDDDDGGKNDQIERRRRQSENSLQFPSQQPPSSINDQTNDPDPYELLFNEYFAPFSIESVEQFKTNYARLVERQNMYLDMLSIPQMERIDYRNQKKFEFQHPPPQRNNRFLVEMENFLLHDVPKPNLYAPRSSSNYHRYGSAQQKQPQQQNNRTQLLIGIDDQHRLRVYQLYDDHGDDPNQRSQSLPAGGGEIYPIATFPLKLLPSDYVCVKMRSFVQNDYDLGSGGGGDHHQRASIAKFRLYILLQFKRNPKRIQNSIISTNGQLLLTDDLLTIYTFDGYYNLQNGFVSRVMPSKLSYGTQGSAHYSLMSTFGEQIIKRDTIEDFDIYTHEHGSSSSSSLPEHYLIVAQQQDHTTNHRYALELYQLVDKDFDQIVSLRSEEANKAYRVKLFPFQASLYLLVCYDWHGNDELEWNTEIYAQYHPAVRVFKVDLEHDHQSSSSSSSSSYTKSTTDHDPSIDGMDRIVYQTSIYNATIANGDVRSIHYLDSGSSYLYIQLSRHIVVYWFLGESISYMDTLHIPPLPQTTGNDMINTFDVTQMADLSTPLIVAGAGRRFVTFEKQWDQYVAYTFDLDTMLMNPDGSTSIAPTYSIVSIQVFDWFNHYYLWALLRSSDGAGPNGLHTIPYLIRVRLREPENSDEIFDYQECMVDLKNRLESGIREQNELKTIGEDLLVITPAQPIIRTVVHVGGTFRTDRLPGATMVQNRTINDRRNYDQDQNDQSRIHLNISSSLLNSDDKRSSPSPVTTGAIIQRRLREVHNRLKVLQDRITHEVVTYPTVPTYGFNSSRTATTTPTIIRSPVIFTTPLVIREQFVMKDVHSGFYLNGIHMDLYANDTLRSDSIEQELHYADTTIVFRDGLRVDSLHVREHLNRISIRDVIRIDQPNLNASTMMPTMIKITGEHRYTGTVHLHNGTTSGYINNVPLTHLVQDVHYPTPLLRGRKSFANLTTTAIQVDSSFNRINLRQFISNIVWLENDRLPFQRLSDGSNAGGGGIEFLGPVHSSNYTTVKNRINNVLDLSEFIHQTARTDKPVTLPGPVWIQQQPATVYGNVRIDGLLNGEYNLQRDVILLRGDQDFSEMMLNQLNFDNIVTFAGGLQVTETLNGVQPELEYVLRSELEKTLLPVNSSSAAATAATKTSSIMLSGKRFLNNVQVLGDVVMDRDDLLINGVNLNQLYHQLDSVTAFNTPLIVDELIINGNMRSSNGYNQYPTPYVHDVLHSRLLLSKPQTFNVPIGFGRKIFAKNLRFNITGNGLRFPEDFVFRHQTTPSSSPLPPLIINGAKYFLAPVTIQDSVHLSPPQGLINGHRITKWYQSLVRNDTQYRNQSSSMPAQTIGGVKHFHHLTIHGDLLIDDGLLNDCYIDKVVCVRDCVPSGQAHRQQQVLKQLQFEELWIDGATKLKVNDLTITGALNHEENFPKFLSDLVLYNRSDPNVHHQSSPPLILYNKHFPTGITVHHVHLANQSKLGTTALHHLMSNAVTLDTIQDIYESIHFHNATFAQIEQFDTINHRLTPEYFSSVVLKSSNPIVIYGGDSKTFHGTLNITKLVVDTSLINNRYNLTNIVHNSMMRQGDQIITAKHIFLRSIRIGSLHFAPHIRLSGVRFDNIVQLRGSSDSESSSNNHHVIQINSDILFEKLYEIESLQIDGLLNQCNLTTLWLDGVHRNQTTKWFDLYHRYDVLPSLTIRRNLYLPPLVNDGENFLKNIVVINDDGSNDRMNSNSAVSTRPMIMMVKPLMHKMLRFTNEIFIKHLRVNGLITIIGDDRQPQPPQSQPQPLHHQHQRQYYNLTHLLNDAVYSHIPQHITGVKKFRRPLRIYGAVRQTSSSSPGGGGGGGQLYIGGLLASVNVSRLFANTATIDQTLSPPSSPPSPVIMSGNKKFSGRIRFLAPVQVGTINGYIRVPEDFYLRHSPQKPETIYGQVHFAKRVHLHENLRARLINHLNLTEFISNCIFLQYDPSALPSVSPRMSPPAPITPTTIADVTAVLRFVDEIHVRNLTIIHRINDIPVNQLIHTNGNNDGPTVIDGEKVFHQPLDIIGNLHVRLINGQNFEQDLAQQWIDTRGGDNGAQIRSNSANPSTNNNITGTLIFTKPIEVDEMNIEQSLNNFTIDQFTPQYFDALNQTIYRLNDSLGAHLRLFDQSLAQKRHQNQQRQWQNEHAIITDYLHNLRHFQVLENFQDPIWYFEPIIGSGNGGPSITTGLMAIFGQHWTSTSSSTLTLSPKSPPPKDVATCINFQSRYFALQTPSGGKRGRDSGDDINSIAAEAAAIASANYRQQRREMAMSNTTNGDGKDDNLAQQYGSNGGGGGGGGAYYPSLLQRRLVMLTTARTVDQTPLIYDGGLQYSLNMRTIVVRSISSRSATSIGEEFLLIHSIYSNKPVCFGHQTTTTTTTTTAANSTTDARYVNHRIQYNNGNERYYPAAAAGHQGTKGEPNVVVELPEMEMEIVRAKFFAHPTLLDVKYLAILYSRLISAKRIHGSDQMLDVYRLTLSSSSSSSNTATKEFALKRIQRIQPQQQQLPIIWDIDVTQVNHPQHPPLVLLSVVFDGKSSSSLSPLWKWNDSVQNFVPIVGTMEKQSEYWLNGQQQRQQYRRTHFVQHKTSSESSIFALYSTVGQYRLLHHQWTMMNTDDRDRQERYCNDLDEHFDAHESHYIDIWQWRRDVTPGGGSGDEVMNFRHFQRLYLHQDGDSDDDHQNAIGDIVHTQVGIHLYLFTLTRANHLSAYRLDGYNGFIPLWHYPVQGITSINTFWYDRQFYLALGSTVSYESQLLIAPTSGIRESVATIEENSVYDDEEEEEEEKVTNDHHHQHPNHPRPMKMLKRMSELMNEMDESIMDDDE